MLREFQTQRRRGHIVRIVLLTPLFAACFPDRARESSQTRPTTNVVLVTVDTLRADHVGCYRLREVSTPHMDALAHRGTRFDQAIAQVPLTTPSHASILTGTYPPIHQIREVGGFRLAEGVPTLAGILQRQGYRTAAFVSAAVLSRRYGLDRGFDTYDDRFADEREVLPGVVAEIRADEVGRRAVDWIQEHIRRKPAGQSQPFLLWVHYYDPHFPYDPPEPFRARYQDPYVGEIAFVDEQLGKLFGALESHHLMSKTLVVLLSDHGEGLGEHGEQMHGVFLYDSTMRIPLIIAGPGVPEGRVVTQQVRSIDLMPTILDHLGVPHGDKCQGTSLLPAIRDGKRVRSHYCYMETLYPKTQMRWSELRALRTEEWKLILAPSSELYHLQKDPAETQNVVRSHPAEADRLQKQVWKVAGPPQTWGAVEPAPLDEQTHQELRSLGYASSGASRKLVADMSGPDPKARVPILRDLDRVTGLINQRHFKAAQTILQKLIPQDPGNPLIYKYLALCFQNARQLEKVRKTYLQAIQNGADTDQTYSNLGQIEIRLGRLSEAVQYLRKAIELNPRDVESFNNLAMACLQLGRSDEAERAVRAVLIQDARHGAAFNLLGLIQVSRKEAGPAKESFQTAIRLKPEMAEPYLNLALLARDAGENSEAIRYFTLFMDKASTPEHRRILPQVRSAIRRLPSATPAP